MDTVAKIEEFLSNFISRQEYNTMDIIQLSSEESDIETELQTSTLHTELDIQNENDTFQKRMNHETASIVKHSKSFPILYKILTEKNVKNNTDTSVLHTELDIKDESDISTHILLDRVEDEQIIIENQDRTDLSPFPNKIVETERVESEKYLEKETAGYMDTMNLKTVVDSQNDTDMSKLHTELDIRNYSDTSTTSDTPTPLSDWEIRRDPATHGKADGIVFICYNCEYTINRKHLLIRHMEVHMNRRNMYSCDYCRFQTYLKRSLTAHMRSHPSNKCHACLYCSATFKRKQSLDNHILNKHPTSLLSVTSKIHQCLQCPYKTTLSRNLKLHLMKHPVKAVETEVKTTKSLEHSATTANYRSHACTGCSAMFFSKTALDDHIMKKHPSFVPSVTIKIYGCKYCSYKTTSAKKRKRHLLKHPETAADHEYFTCLHCNEKYQDKRTLGDHIMNNHQSFVSSVTSKIYECTKCHFKTTLSDNLKLHLMTHTVEAVEIEVETTKSDDMENSLEHSGITANYQFHACTGCNATFLSKTTLDDHIIRKHPSLISSVTSKILECKYCTYKTIYTKERKRHLLKHPETAADYEYLTCTYCNAKYQEKRALGNHIINKHPSFVSSVTSKIYECAICTFKTTYSLKFKEHLSNHLGTAVNTCTHCNVAFKSKHGLDYHIVSKHPDLVSSVTRKIHECTKCSFKTTSTSQLKIHSLKHPETAANFKFITCIHCEASFRSKLTLDEHIIKKHPNFISSVTRKLHECTMCSFKTTSTKDWNTHLFKHPETAARYKYNICVHCKASFKSKLSLDNHIIEQHPNFISSVTNKVYECTKCTFKTVRATSFNSHLLKHSETSALCKRSTCIHCSKVFINKTRLNEHIIRKHPDFIASVTSKIHECKECSFKSTNANVFENHLLNHPETAALYILSTCEHCKASFRSKMALDDHTIKKHPTFISSVTYKIHECTKCTFKTTISTHLKTHLLTHTKTKEVITKTSVRC